MENGSKPDGTPLTPDPTTPLLDLILCVAESAKVEMTVLENVSVDKQIIPWEPVQKELEQRTRCGRLARFHFRTRDFCPCRFRSTIPGKYKWRNALGDREKCMAPSIPEQPLQKCDVVTC